MKWYVEYMMVVRLIYDIQIILSGIKFNLKKIFCNFTTSWLVKTIRRIEKEKKYITYGRSL